MPSTGEATERSKVALSSPSILHSVFQARAGRSLELKVVETLMTYTRSVCGDLLYVMAYGTTEVLEPAIHMMNRYYPSVEFGTITEHRSGHPEDQIAFNRCESTSCAQNSVDGFINTADVICLDPKICCIEHDAPPPLYLCSSCSIRLNTNGSSLFVNVLRSIGNIPEQCENPDCYSNRRSGLHFCFSKECATRNRRKPMRLCHDCNECLHGNGSTYEHHIVHSNLVDLWSMKNPTQTYLVDTIARLLSEAHPSFRERCIEMGIDADDVNFHLPEFKDGNFYEKITRSLHGLGLLKALSPIPPSTYNYELIGQLLSVLFAWLEAVACTSSLHLNVVEIVERDQAQAIEWITKVERYDFELYCDCLLPLPPVQARVGLPWKSLMSRNRQQLEGLQRLSVLVKFGLIPEQVWERILPFWMQELRDSAGTNGLGKFKTILSRIFDVTSLEAPSYSLNFIKRRLQNLLSSERQEGLVWLQMLSALDVKLNFTELLSMFLESSTYSAVAHDDEGETETMFPFPDPSTYGDMSRSSGLTSPSQSPFVSPMLASVQSSYTYFILLMDILIKQLSLRDANVETMPDSSNEAISLTRLLVAIVDQRKQDRHDKHASNTSCHYCQITGIFYYQITFLLDYILPKEVHMESPIKGATSNRGGSSIRSRISSVGTVVEHKSLRGSNPLVRELEVDESCDADISSSRLAEVDGSAVASVTAASHTPDGSDSESESLSSWKDRIRGITRDSSARKTSLTKDDSIQSNVSWCNVYNEYPEIELTVLLLQHIFKYNDANILDHILKSITMLCVRGECLYVSEREDKNLTYYLQTVLFIPSLWEMLQSSNSYLAQKAVPLLIHCVSMPFGAARLCDEIESVFNNDDWKKRFAAVEKVSLLCQFLTVDIINDSSLAKSTLVHGLVYLVSAIDDVHNAVSARAKTMVSSINETSLRLLYLYMEEHFRREGADRLMLLHVLRSLNSVLANTSPFSAKFFLKLFSHLMTKANKYSSATPSGTESISSWMSDDESAFRSPYIPIWSRTLSSPGRMTDLRSSMSTAGHDYKRPRSLSAPLVLYKQKYTLQFDRQSSIIPTTTEESEESPQAAGSDTTATKPRKRRIWTPDNDLFNRGKNAANPLLNGNIEPRIGEEANEQEEDEASKRTVSISSISLSNKSLITSDHDSCVLHYLVSIMMEYLADSNAASEDRVTVDDIRELIAIIKQFMVALTNDYDGDLSMRPDDLRNCTVFLAYMFGLTPILDCNPFVGKELIGFTLQLMLQSVKDEANKTEFCDLNIDRLDPPVQHSWLMNLLVILYKYSFSEHRILVTQLITIVMNSVNSHQHNICIHVPNTDTMMTDGRIKGNKKNKNSGPAKSKQSRIDRIAKFTDEVDFKDSTEESFQMSILRQDVTRCSELESEMTRIDTPVSSESSFSKRLDSCSSVSNEGSITLNRLVSSRKCDDCGCTVSDHEEEIVNLCIVVLSTFIHREPEMAAPLLMNILCIVSRKCQRDPNSSSTFNLKIPGLTAGLASQFIRCIFVQLSPNGLFAELFRCETFDKEFFMAVVSSLTGFDVLNEMVPLTNVLQDFSSRSNRSDRGMIFLNNLKLYFDCVRKDRITLWESLLHELESFFKNLPAVLPAVLESSCLFQIMNILLGIGKHFAKSMLPSFGHIVAHILRKCDFRLKDLCNLCETCYGAFSKEREKMFIVRTVQHDVALIMKDKSVTHERNVKRIIQLVFMHGESWFSFEPGDIELKRKFGSREGTIGAMHSIQMNQHEMVDFIKNWDFRLKVRTMHFNTSCFNAFGNDTRDVDDDLLDEYSFPIQLKASLAQILALYIKLKRETSTKAPSRVFAWLRSAPTQLSRVDNIQECNTNLQLLAWLLLGAINNAVDYPESHEVIHFISLMENLHIAEYVKNVLQNIVRQDTTNAESDPLATIMEFWSQITFTIVQLLSESDKVKLDLLEPLLRIMDGIAKCSGFAFRRLSTLLFPLIQYYLDDLPDEYKRSFRVLEKYSVKPDDPKPELKDLINSVRLRLTRLKRAGSKFDPASVQDGFGWLTEPIHVMLGGVARFFPFFSLSVGMLVGEGSLLISVGKFGKCRHIYNRQSRYKWSRVLLLDYGSTKLLFMSDCWHVHKSENDGSKSTLIMAKVPMSRITAEAEIADNK
eukprot:gene19917-21865_t